MKSRMHNPLQKLWMPGADRPKIAVRVGLVNWPTCARCGTPVEEYGVDEETSKEFHVYAKCHGKSDGVRLVKPVLWTPNVKTAMCARLVFFAPSDVT